MPFSKETKNRRESTVLVKCPNLNNEDVKKAKLEPKSTKKRPPGCEEERYTETSYYLENNLRKVVPYYFGRKDLKKNAVCCGYQCHNGNFFSIFSF